MVLQKEIIPDEIVEEFSEHYDNINWNYYGMSIEEIGRELYERMVSRKLNYKISYDDHGEHKIIDPYTFKKKTVYSSSIECFMVRGIFDDETSTMYLWQVLTSGKMVDLPDIQQTEQGDS